MADTAFQRQYRQEFISGFEKRQALSRHTVVTETEVNGNEAVFLVADSGGATAVTRGVNGDIPTRPDNLNQYTCTLQEWHDVPERTNFNIFASQGNGREIMQRTSMSVINRKIDADIHAALGTGTVNLGAAAVASLELVTRAHTILSVNFANETDDGEVWALITPAFYGKLLGVKEFASADYIKHKHFEDISKSKAFNWIGVNFIVDAGLPGTGTNSASCWFYNSNAVGHACDTETIKSYVGYDDKNDKSWARCTVYMGSKLLQNSGVVKVLHDDSSYAPA